MTKVTNRQSLPALDNSKSVKNPDLLKIADKNYTDTILKYAGLAIKFPQLETEAKQIVPAINELKNSSAKLEPATKNKLGGIMVGNSLTITQAGKLDCIEYWHRITLDVNKWENYGSGSPSYYYIEYSALPSYHGGSVYIVPAPESLDTWHSYGMRADYFSDESIQIISNYLPETTLYIYAVYNNINSDEGTSTITDVYRMHKLPIYTVLLSKSKWNRSNHIIKVDNIISGSNGSRINDHSEQIILPMPATSSLNIENNIALQEANIQDAGQGYNYIKLYAENVPNKDLYIRILCNG